MDGTLQDLPFKFFFIQSSWAVTLLKTFGFISVVLQYPKIKDATPITEKYPAFSSGTKGPNKKKKGPPSFKAYTSSIDCIFTKGIFENDTIIHFVYLIAKLTIFILKSFDAEFLKLRRILPPSIALNIPPSSSYCINVSIRIR